MQNYSIFFFELSFPLLIIVFGKECVYLYTLKNVINLKLILVELETLHFIRYLKKAKS
jgi:hypothetical protein